MNQFVHVGKLQPIEFEDGEETCNVFKLLSEIEITFFIARRVSEDGLNLGRLKCLRIHQFRG